MKFNLRKTLNKTAMGYQHYSTREQSQWWDVDQLVENGVGRARWLRALRQNPSLAGVLERAKEENFKQKERYRRQYGLSDSARKYASKFLLGYNPLYGAYLLSIGPYTSSNSAEFANNKNKFHYYPMKISGVSLENVPDVIMTHLGEKCSRLQEAVQFDPLTDFGLKEPDQEDKVEGKRAVFKQDPNKIFLDLENPNPHAQALLGDPSRPHILNTGARVGLNERGMRKLIDFFKGDPLLGRFYQEVLAGIAERSPRYNTPQEVEDDCVRKANDINNSRFQKEIINGIYVKLGMEWDRMSPEERAAAGLPNKKPTPPNLFWTPGSVRFQPLSNNKVLAAQLELRKDVAQKMAEGLTDPKEIADALNSDPEFYGRRRNQLLREKMKVEEIAMETDPSRQRWIESRTAIPEEEVSLIMNKIEEAKNQTGPNGETLPPKTNEEMVAHYQEMAENNKNKRGYDTLTDALEMGSLYVSGAPSDPVFRAKMESSIDAPAFELPDYILSGDARIDANFLEEYKDGRPVPPELLGQALEEAKEDEIEAESQETDEQATTKEIEEETGVAEDEIGVERTQPEPMAATPEAKPVKVVDDLPIPANKAAPTAPKPEQKKVPGVFDDLEDEEDLMPEGLEKLFRNSLGLLIKVASELDEEGKGDKAEEIHKIIRKYI